MNQKGSGFIDEGGEAEDGEVEDDGDCFGRKMGVSFGEAACPGLVAGMSVSSRGCKNWYTIIINPSFVTKHLNHHNNSGRLFVNRYDKISNKYVFSLFSDQTLAGSPPEYQDVVVDLPNCIWISSCNGLLCLSYSLERFALWNPATREFRSLPLLPRNFTPNVVSSQETFGFGLDPITNDYKVVWIWDSEDDIRDIKLRAYEVAVYTHSTHSWKYLDVALPYSSIDIPQSNTYINGVYHWFAIDNEGHHVILAFDMGNELFHEIHGIPCSKCASLVPYNNSLALIYYDCNPVEIWVMREEGGRTKQFTVELSGMSLPFGFWKNGQLITEIGCGHMALYDPETCEIKYIGSCIWIDCFVYRESLVVIRGVGDRLLEQDQLSDVDQILNFSNVGD
ncbi:F-box/kelch-repeat protein At3g06240-like [Cornus florida]|uniref:F-box/kelch-repeat protein At3g06240-like n=1 Tax=Cornus florida TaxID=4283 RepID=UPI00289DE1E1|nr:F-box/kelch-repeat protein At3g06240-like [Cornus florida]